MTVKPSAKHQGRIKNGTSWRHYPLIIAFGALVFLIVAQVLAMIVYVLLPERESDTPSYYPHDIYRADGSVAPGSVSDSIQH